MFYIMIKTQIQLPDALYREAKRVAEEREMSMAEVVRRGLEYITQAYPALAKPAKDWKLPGPFDLGVKADPFENPAWREEANLGSGALSMVREPRKTKYGSKKGSKGP
jgi:hypothetical protein